MPAISAWSVRPGGISPRPVVRRNRGPTVLTQVNASIAPSSDAYRDRSGRPSFRPRQDGAGRNPVLCLRSVLPEQRRLQPWQRASTRPTNITCSRRPITPRQLIITMRQPTITRTATPRGPSATPPARIGMPSTLTGTPRTPTSTPAHDPRCGRCALVRPPSPHLSRIGSTRSLRCGWEPGLSVAFSRAPYTLHPTGPPLTDHPIVVARALERLPRAGAQRMAHTWRPR